MLISKAESLKNLEVKITKGGFPTPEEIASVPGVNGLMIFGYSEQERIASKYHYLLLLS